MKGILFALGGFAIFSLHDVVLKLLADYSVFQIVFFAMLFGYVPFSIGRMFDKQAIALRPVNPALVLLRSVLVTTSLCCAVLAFSLLPMVQVYVLIFMTPLIISVLAIPVLGEKIHVFRWMTILLGLVGIVIVLRPTADTLQAGHLFALIAAFASAGAAIIARKIGHIEKTATMMLTPMIMNILVSGSLLYFVYQPMPIQDLALMFLVGALALAAHLLLLAAYRSAPASLVAPMQYSQLVWAIVYGSLFFGEQVDRFIVLGTLITILSGLLMVWRETKVSTVKPILRTRNIRMVSAAPVPGSERDKSSK